MRFVFLRFPFCFPFCFSQFTAYLGAGFTVCLKVHAVVYAVIGCGFLVVFFRFQLLEPFNWCFVFPATFVFHLPSFLLRFFRGLFSFQLASSSVYITCFINGSYCAPAISSDIAVITIVFSSYFSFIFKVIFPLTTSSLQKVGTMPSC